MNFLATAPRSNHFARLLAAAVTLSALVVAADGQRPAAARPGGAPAQIVLQPRYRAGARYAWRLRVHSVIRRTQAGQTASATLDNQAVVVMHVISGGATSRDAAAAPVVVALRFRQYHTTVAGFGPLAAALRRTAAATDQAALHTRGLELRLSPGAATQIVAVGRPPAPREARTMVRQLLTTAGLPLGAVRPGESWSRGEIQKLPQFHFSFPLPVHGRFVAWRPGPAGSWLAAVHSTSHADVTLPPGATPGFQAAAAAGYASQARLRIDGRTASRFAPSGILVRARSHTHTWLRMQLIGGAGAGIRASPVAEVTEMHVDSTGSVRAIAPSRRPAAPPAPAPAHR